VNWLWVRSDKTSNNNWWDVSETIPTGTGPCWAIEASTAFDNGVKMSSLTIWGGIRSHSSGYTDGTDFKNISALKCDAHEWRRIAINTRQMEDDVRRRSEVVDGDGAADGGGGG